MQADYIRHIVGHVSHRSTEFSGCTGCTALKQTIYPYHAVLKQWRNEFLKLNSSKNLWNCILTFRVDKMLRANEALYIKS